MEINETVIPLVPRFPLETDLESGGLEGLEGFIQRNYHHSFYYAAVYLLSVYCLQRYMEGRKPIDLRWGLALWNSALALLSLLGALRTGHELLHSLAHFGLQHTICDDRYYYVSGVMACWCHVIVLCKVLELLDTVFLVLRKRKVIFLHWFHHSSVLVFTWVIAKDRCAVTRWYMAMNYTIHAAMYAYYSFRALGVKVPRPLAVSLTLAQILQMMVGFAVSLLGLRNWFRGQDCSVTGRVAVFATTLYTFYFLLFVHFFLNSYVLPRLRKSRKTQ